MSSSTSIRSRRIALLFICQYMSLTCSTRLPLEVYELTPVTTTTPTTSNLQKQQPTQHQQQSTDNNNLQHFLFKHKNLEYTIVEPRPRLENETFNSQDDDDHSISSRQSSSSSHQPLDRRRSRQMLKYHNSPTATLYLQKLHQHHHHHHEQQQQQKSKDTTNSNNSDHNNDEDADPHNNHDNNINVIINQPPISITNGNNVAAAAAATTANKTTKNVAAAVVVSSMIHGRNVRVLYQVGESEADLPVCAPNAVCSKIDLYETPWIERQCRCPNVIHHYNYNTNNNNNNNEEEIEIITKPSNNNKQQQHNYLNHAEKLRNYYEKETKNKQQQQQQPQQYNSNSNNGNNNGNSNSNSNTKKHTVHFNDYNEKKYESLHLKKLMQKLGAVYEEDLQLKSSDYLNEQKQQHDDDNNDALLPTLEDSIDEIEENEYQLHRGGATANIIGSMSTHMRHSGHVGSGHNNKGKEISYIGGCPSSLGIEDGHTIADKTRHYKLCQPVHKLPVCKHFRDYTWTLTTSNELNITEQIVHCRCPKNSVTYLTKRQPAPDGLNGYTYLFACSPLTRIRCQRKQPCKLFTVRKRQEFLDEVNINALCQCPKGHRCPSHHTQAGVIAGESFIEDNIQTYSGYCMAND